jgi:FkbM family methyltransferase
MKNNIITRMLKIAVSNLPEVKREAVIDLVKRVSKSVVFSFPKFAQEAVFEQMCDDFGGFAVISRFAQDCNVVALRVSGKYGVIQSDPNDTSVLKQYAQTGVWAERTNSLLRSFFANTGGNYIDIGANIGLTTIPVAQNPQVRCLAIEPEPKNFANLCINVIQNCPYNNVEVRQLAMFARREKLSLELSSGNLGDHRLRIGEKARLLGEERRLTTEVDAVPLDEIAGGLSEPLAVKIDTQGAEPFVVSGGKETLGRAGLLVSEFWPYGMSRLGGNAMDFIEFLRNRFSTLAIAMKEDEPVLAPRPSAEVCEQLSALIEAHSDNPRMYLDVIARR